MFLFIFLRVAVSASCQEPCCPAHIMFFYCVTLLCYAPDVEQIKMTMMMMMMIVDDASALWTAYELPHRCPQVFVLVLELMRLIGGSGCGWQCLCLFSKQEHWPSQSGQLALGDSFCAALP